MTMTLVLVTPWYLAVIVTLVVLAVGLVVTPTNSSVAPVLTWAKAGTGMMSGWDDVSEMLSPPFGAGSEIRTRTCTRLPPVALPEADILVNTAAAAAGLGAKLIANPPTMSTATRRCSALSIRPLTIADSPLHSPRSPRGQIACQPAAS